MLKFLPPLQNGSLRRKDRSNHQALFALRRRFQQVSKRTERRTWWSRHRARVTYVAMFAIAMLWIGWNVYPTAAKWPIMVTLRHLAAAPNCDAARAVGLAPALRGHPGYYDRHDADTDGVACEPWPR